MLSHALAPADIRAALHGHLATIAERGGIRPVRLPETARQRAFPMLRLVSGFTTGVSLRLATSATRLRLEADVARLVMAHLDEPVSPATFEVEVDGAVTDRVDLRRTDLVRETGDDATIGTLALDLSLGAGGTEVVVWLPPDASVVIHSVSADAPLAPLPASQRRVWLHHGSSISQCGDADGPLRTWPAQAARLLGVESVNLGFGGNAMLDHDVARAIAAAQADVITLKLGVNVVTSDAMRLRAFVPALHGFLDTVRDGHPTTPIALITAISCPALEDTPGPIRSTAGGIEGTPRDTRPGDGTLTLQATREALARVVGERADPLLSLDDGRTLLGPDDVHLLADGIHPDQEGYDLIARRFAARARAEGTGLGRAFSF